MQIPYFAANQNVVFIPALLVLLPATVLICLPIIFGPNLRKSKRRTPLLVLDGVAVVALLVGAALLAGTGFRTLGDERAAVQAQIETTYGVRLDAGEVGELVDGGKPTKAIPAAAEALGLKKPGDLKTLELKPTVVGGDVYELYFAKKPFPTST